MGQTRKSTVYQYQERIAQIKGWQNWRIADEERIICLALKPEKGASWPKFSKEYKTLYGGAGFYMVIADNVKTPYFGFYGQYPYRRLSTAQVNGKTITDTDNLNTVLSWQGLEVSFRIPTQPSRDNDTDIHEALGAVDFTGVEQAYRSMMQCHARNTV